MSEQEMYMFMWQCVQKMRRRTERESWEDVRRHLVRCQTPRIHSDVYVDVAKVVQRANQAKMKCLDAA